MEDGETLEWNWKWLDFAMKLHSRTGSVKFNNFKGTIIDDSIGPPFHKCQQ